MSSMILLFITKHCSKTMLLWCHFVFSCILVRRQVNTIVMRVPLPVTKKERGEKGKSASALRWKTDTHIVVHGFAAKFSNKKAEYYYMHYYITVTVNSKLTIFKFILHALPHNRMAFIPPPPSTHKVYHA